jgi:hypothetical protein
MLDHVSITVSNMESAAAFLRDPDGNRIEAVCHRLEETAPWPSIPASTATRMPIDFECDVLWNAEGKCYRPFRHESVSRLARRVGMSDDDKKRPGTSVPLDPKTPEGKEKSVHFEDLPAVDPEAPQPPDPDQAPPIEHETDPSKRPPVVPEAPQPTEE